MGAVTFSLDEKLATFFRTTLNTEVFVETGTFRGDTLAIAAEHFAEVHSIELASDYYQAGCLRFAALKHVKLWHGDSPLILAGLMTKLQVRSALFFLDAHWCAADGAAGGSAQSPLIRELEAIGHLNDSSAIVIDDARLYLSPPPIPHDVTHWPGLTRILKELSALGDDHEVMVVNDCILYFPSAIRLEMWDFARIWGVDWLQVLHNNGMYRHEIETLRTTCEERERLIQRLDLELRRHKAEGAALVGRDSAAVELPHATTGDTDIAEEDLPGGIARDLARLDAQLRIARMRVSEQAEQLRLSREELEEAQTGLREKEEVIRGLLVAIRRCDRSPWLLFLSAARPVWRLGRLVQPRLGRLYDHPAIPIRMPSPVKTTTPRHELPTIAIVTPSYGQGQFIEQTILSVLDQDYPQVDYFIQDGGSTDETLAVLDRYRDRLSGFESHEDGGQAHAINLGFSRTRGDIMCWLNSDDVLLPGSLAYVGDFFARHPEVDVVYGNRILMDEQGAEIGRWVLPPHRDEVLSWADFVPQETLFWRRRIWDAVGGCVDESFRFAMDWDLLLRFRDAGARMVRLPRFLGGFRVHDAQKTTAEISGVGFAEMDLLRGRELGGAAPTPSRIRRALLPYMVEHVLHDLMFRVRLRLAGFR